MTRVHVAVVSVVVWLVSELLVLPCLAGNRYFYIGGTRPDALLAQGDCQWTNSGVHAAYDWIMNLNDGADTWEIRIATNYNEVLTGNVVLDRLQSGGAASASKVSGLFGARIWDATTASHAAVTVDYRKKSVLDGNNWSVQGGLIVASSTSGLSVGPTIDGLKLVKGGVGTGAVSYGGGIYCTVSKTTLSNLEIANCRPMSLGRNYMAVNVTGSDCLMTDCYIHDNIEGSYDYSNLVLITGDRTLVRNCKFSNNGATTTAGISLHSTQGGAEGAIVNCEFRGNTVRSSGILNLGRQPGATVVNTLIADNHSAAGSDAGNYFSNLSGNIASPNQSYFVNMTIADNYDATPTSPETPGVTLFGETGGNGDRVSYVMNCLFKNNHGITNSGSTSGWVVYSLGDDAIPNIGSAQSNLTGTALFEKPTNCRLTPGSPGINAGGYVMSTTRSGKAFKFIDVNRDSFYTICRDVIVWAESGLTLNPPVSGADFDIVATNQLGTWDSFGIYAEGGPRLSGSTIDMGAFETLPAKGTVITLR